MHVEKCHFLYLVKHEIFFQQNLQNMRSNFEQMSSVSISWLAEFEKRMKKDWCLGLKAGLPRLFWLGACRWVAKEQYLFAIVLFSDLSTENAMKII